MFRQNADEKSDKRVRDAIQLHEDLLQNDYFSGTVSNLKMLQLLYTYKTSFSFCLGTECGWADYMVWPFLERLEAMELLSGGRFSVRKDKHVKLTAYFDRMKKRPEVKIFYHTPERHMEYFLSSRNGSPNFDVGLPKSVI